AAFPSSAYHCKWYMTLRMTCATSCPCAAGTDPEGGGVAWAPVLTSVPVVLGPSGFLGVGGGAICVGSGGGLLPPLLPIPPPAQPEMTAKASRTMQPSSSRCD